MVIKNITHLAQKLAAVKFVTALASFCLMLVVSTVSAQAQTISAIDINGNQRVENETILSYLSFGVGDRYTQADANTSLKSLFQTGLFKDVGINLSGRTVIVRVEENPVIGRVSFEGNKKIKDEQFSQLVRSKERGVLTQSRVQSDIRMILESYRRLGRFDAEVVAKTIERSNNRVDLVFEITENKKSRIRGITFVGNQRYSDSRLRDVMSTTEAGFLNFLSTRDVYDPDRLDADLEQLRRFYLNAGYADFEIISSVADFDREENAFFVTITMQEGERYRFGDISIDSILDLDTDALDGAIKVRSGDIYSAEEVDQTLEALTLAAAQQGYALARVRPRGFKNTDEKTVDIAFQLEEGPRVYIERIDITGNLRTREYVIRREFDVDEGDAFNQVLIDRARLRLTRMGLFETVNITRQQGSSPDRVIVNVEVAEASSASLSLGGGYSTGNGPIFDVAFEEKNLLGRGQKLKASFGIGTQSRNYQLSFTEPRFLGRRVSAGFDLYHKDVDYSDQASYELLQTGGRVRLGFLVSDRLSFNTSYLLEESKITVTNSSSASQAVIDAAGTSLKSALSYGLVYNSLDNFNDPTTGFYLAANQEIAGLGGDVNYVRTTARGSAYHPIVGSVIGLVSGKVGHISGYDNQDIRLIDTFKIGGETVRGFSSFGIGPRDSTGSEDALGGTFFWGATAEAQFPIPGVSKSLGLKGAVFADAGSLMDVGDIGSLNTANIVGDEGTIRSSVGASVIWASPFGPLRFDFAKVLSKETGDKEQFFKFGIDTKF